MDGKDNDEKHTASSSDEQEWFKCWKDQHEQLLRDLDEESRRLRRDLGLQSRKDTNDHSDNRSPGAGMIGPFSAFKRFVDDGISSLSSAFSHDSPSTAIAELKARMQHEQERYRAEEQDISERWTGSSDSPDFVQLEIDRALSSKNEEEGVVDSTLELLEQSKKMNAFVPARKIEALFKDREESELGGLLDMLGGFVGCRDLSLFGSPSPRWLSVEWFKRDAYSPIRLEAHSDLGKEGARWRAAFEDLLYASLDKPMRSVERVGMRDPYGKAPQSTYLGPGLDWMLSLQCRGILPMQIPRVWNTSAEVGRELCSPGAKHWLSKSTLLARPAMIDNPALVADLVDLCSAVATKAAPETGAEPLPIRLHPDTEEDLYDSEYLFPGVASADSEVKKSVDETSGTVESRDAGDSQELNLRNTLRAKGVQLVGEQFEEFMSTSPTTEQMLSRVARLQQEWDAIEDLSDARSRKPTHQSKHEQSPAVEERRTQANERPDVLSALTTTHTTRLPDGTVTTKVVLKQRFADGREETTESLHTMKEAVTEQDVAQQTQAEQTPKKNGWFWT